MGFSFYQPEDAPHWARKKYQEPEEIMYYGGMGKPLNLSLDRTAKAPLAEQIRKGVSTAIEDGVLEPGPALATALVASVPDAKAFRSGRHFSAWIGLVPKQRSSGGRERLFGISERGDRYLRTLLIHGAHAALSRAGGKQDARSRWLSKLRERRHPNIVAVALANKNARIVWALLSSNEAYDPGLTTRPA